MPLEAPYFSLIAPTLTAHLRCDKRQTQLPTLQEPGKNSDYQATQSETNRAFLASALQKSIPVNLAGVIFKRKNIYWLFWKPTRMVNSAFNISYLTNVCRDLRMPLF